LQQATAEIRNAYNIFIGKPEQHRQIYRLRSRWDVIKMDHKEAGCEDVKQIQLVHDIA
jgi:hypothetical protein